MRTFVKTAGDLGKKQVLPRRPSPRLAVVLIVRFSRTGGPAMLAMMGGGPDDLAGHDQAGHEHGVHNQNARQDRISSNHHSSHHEAHARTERPQADF